MSPADFKTSEPTNLVLQPGCVVCKRRTIYFRRWQAHVGSNHKLCVKTGHLFTFLQSLVSSKGGVPCRLEWRIAVEMSLVVKRQLGFGPFEAGALQTLWGGCGQGKASWIRYPGFSCSTLSHCWSIFTLIVKYAKQPDLKAFQQAGCWGEGAA